MKWQFVPPEKGEYVDAPYWSVRVPVDFVIPGRGDPAKPGWHAYVPGPRQSIPWVKDDDASGADAVTAGGMYPLGAGPRLLTAR